MDRKTKSDSGSKSKTERTNAKITGQANTGYWYLQSDNYHEVYLLLPGKACPSIGVHNIFCKINVNMEVLCTYKIDDFVVSA